MITLRFARNGTAALALFALGACSSVGQLGDILGGVLGGGQQANNQVAGTVRGVDTRNQQISLQQSNGQSVALGYDNNTRVVYQNRAYNVSSLESGDVVTARIQQTNNGAYYTDSVVVTQSVSSGSTGGGSGGNVQSLQGTVRQVDRNNGAFTLDAGGNTLLTVSLTYQPSTADVNKFNSLRSGDNVRFYGVYLNNSRVELRQFY